MAQWIEENIGRFHEARIKSIDSLKLTGVLCRKNPYLFRAKYLLTSGDIVSALTDAHISSNEETVFGNWLEELAIFVNQQAYGGRKSGITGIDLEFDHGGTRYIVTIKSGPNWGNSGQVAKMVSDFGSAMKTLRTSGSQLSIVAVNGCCYGRDNHPDKGAYLKYCGQRFWEFISGEPDLYTEIIEPLGRKAKQRHEDFEEARANRVNLLTADFTKLFCNARGEIDWKRLVRFNSATEKPALCPEP